MENEKVSPSPLPVSDPASLEGHFGALGPLLLFLAAPSRLLHGLAGPYVWYKLPLVGHLSHLYSGIEPKYKWKKVGYFSGCLMHPAST